jgi:hypothetical protein
VLLLQLACVVLLRPHVGVLRMLRLHHGGVGTTGRVAAASTVVRRARRAHIVMLTAA